MAMNPMQKKARIAFLLGMFITLVITGVIIGFLIMQLAQTKKKENEIKYANVYVLNQNVQSGEIIRQDMFTMLTLPTTTIPDNAIADFSVLSEYSLIEKNTGYELRSEVVGNVKNLYLQTNEYDSQTQKYKKIEVVIENGRYYKKINDVKYLIEFLEYPLIAKVKMDANTVVTLNYLTRSNQPVTSDLRIQEYNMIVLPTELIPGQYIDIRLRLPSGEDYIVLSKKYVENTNNDTIWIKVGEDEILIMSNVIVEAYIMEGSVLYATTYSEAGMQSASTPTYVTSNSVYELIKANPNITTTASEALVARYSKADVVQQRNTLNKNISNYSDTATSSVEQRTQEEIQKQQNARQEYVQSLGL